MRKVIVFDFNRTIYDPDRRQLLPQVEHVFKNLTERCYELHLISTANASRAQLIKELGISQYFRAVSITDDKAREFLRLSADKEIEFDASFVVGDRVRGEISHGNRAGMQSIWLKAGKFSEELPEAPHEQPRHTVGRLIEILEIIP